MTSSAAMSRACSRSSTAWLDEAFARGRTGEAATELHNPLQAVTEGASALVVVPDASKETAEALAAVDTKKTPVVLLGRAPAGGAPASTAQVAFESFDVSARALVGAVIVEAEKAVKINASRPTPRPSS